MYTNENPSTENTFKQADTKTEATKSIWQLFLGKQVCYITPPLLSEENQFHITGIDDILVQHLSGNGAKIFMFTILFTFFRTEFSFFSPF